MNTQTEAPEMLPLHLHPRPVRALTDWFLDGVTRSYALLGVTATVVLIGVILMATRGQLVTWDGLVPVDSIPVPATDCGSYCGTDAGLITTPAR